MTSCLVCISSLSFPGKYLSVKLKGEEIIIYKGSYEVIPCTWRYIGGNLISVYNDVSIPATFESQGEYYQIRTDQGYLDAYDESETVEEWKKNSHRNQLWKIENGDPVHPNLSEIMNHWSPNKLILEKQHSDYQSDYRLRQSQTEIFHYFEDESCIPAYLRHIPLISINGDTHNELPNMVEIGKLSPENITKYRLLSHRERRLARKMVFASKSLFFAKGGYGCPVKVFEKPIEVVLLSLAGAQFELKELEYRDFIVSRGDSKVSNPLFPRYYKDEYKPGFEEAVADKNNQAIDERTVFLSQPYSKAMVEDLYLILTAFNSMIPPGRKGRLFLTAVGMGFFANLEMKKSIRRYLLPHYLGALEEVVLTKISHLTRISTIVFPDYLGGKYFPPKAKEGKLGKFNVFHELEKDIFDIPFDDEIPGIVNPSDVFSYKGNETGYNSVEAMFGNNSDLRYNQNAVFNPSLNNPLNWVFVKPP